MQLSDYDYELPECLIAHAPLAQRSQSRLMCLNRHDKSIEHLRFSELPSKLLPGDLLVFNNSKVLKARLFGTKSTGGKVEMLVERIVSPMQALVHLKSSKVAKPGTLIHIKDACFVQVLERQNDLYRVRSSNSFTFLELLDAFGHIPLPPYIKREANEADLERYQTVYAKNLGSVAAPTAGLHFDQTLMVRLQQKGINFEYLTLHVGAGTFLPVREQNIQHHTMHKERVKVSDSVCHAINKTKQNGGRVIAVGTTSVRALETAARTGKIEPYKDETELFITPGYKFKVIDGMITNFHLPQSSLLMLVAAFSGLDFMRQAYKTAVESNYRFYSYGDSMLIL